MLSVHTSPLDPPGGGDAGGMNVYIVETAKRLADARRRGRDLHPRHVQRPAAGGRAVARACTCGTSSPARSRGWPRPTCPPSCARSPPASCAPRSATSRAGTTSCTRTTGCPARSAGWRANGGACRWCTRRTPSPRSRTPLLADGDDPEPRARIIGEEQVVGRGRPADRLDRRRGRAARRALRRRPAHACTPSRPASTSTSSRPGAAAAARARLGLRARRAHAAVRRAHPAAEGAGRAAARRGRCCDADPELAGRLQVVVLGAPERHRARPPALPRPACATNSACTTSCSSARPRRARSSPTTTAPPTSPSCRATTSRSGWSRSSRRPAARRSPRPPSAACPPRSPTDVSGVLVDGHDPQQWAKVLADLLRTPAALRSLADGRPPARRALLLGPHRVDGLLAAYGRRSRTARPPDAGRERRCVTTDRGRRRRRRRARRARPGVAAPRRVDASPSRCPASSGSRRPAC